MATFENQVGTTTDNWASNAVGTTFTPSSNHTVTSVDIYQHAGTSAVVKVHITNAASELPTTDLSVSAATATVGGVNNIAIPCVALTSGTLYGIWIEYVSGTYNIDAIAQGSFAKIAYNNANTHTVPNTVTTTETLKFTIYGNSGVCGTTYTPTLTETVSLTASLLKTASRFLSEVLSFVPNLSRGIVPNVASGPNYPTTVADGGGGDAAWVNPANVKAADGANAVGTTHGSGNDTTGQLQATGFNFSIPSGATIKGFVVEVSRSYTFVGGVDSGALDNVLKLVKAGSVVGSNKAAATIYTTSQVIATYGSSTDLWGTTWAASDVNASNFGFSFSGASNSSGTQNVNVDFIRLTVYYQTASSYSQTLTETIATVATLLKATTRPIAESFSLVDSTVRTASRAIAETLSLTATGVNATTRTLADTISSSATFAYLRTASAVLSETITTADSLVRSLAHTFIETLALVDTLLKTASRTFAETISTVDAITRSAARSIVQSIGLTPFVLNSTSRTLADTITNTDTFTYLKAISTNFSEALALVASLTRTASRPLAESIATSDTFQSARTTFASLVETITSTATFTYLRSVAASFTETIADAASLYKTATRPLFETFATIDAMIRTPSRALSEAVAIVASAVRTTNRSMQDGITTLDIVLRSAGRTLTETIASTASVVRTSSRALGEVVSASAVLSTVRMYARSYTESLSLAASFFYRLPSKMRRGIAILLTRGDTEVLDTKRDKIVLESKNDKLIL